MTIYKLEREMPSDIYALTAPIGNNYKMIVNSLLTEEERLRAIKHELAHIRCGHFHRPIIIADAEREADTLADTDTRTLTEILSAMSCIIVTTQ